MSLDVSQRTALSLHSSFLHTRPTCGRRRLLTVAPITLITPALLTLTRQHVAHHTRVDRRRHSHAAPPHPAASSARHPTHTRGEAARAITELSLRCFPHRVQCAVCQACRAAVVLFYTMVAAVKYCNELDCNELGVSCCSGVVHLQS